MTITTAELPDRRPPALPTALRLAPLALAAMLLSAEARADWKFTPGVDLRETYTTNVSAERDDIAHNAFITEVAPGFRLSSKGPRLELEADAQWRLFSYSDKEAPNLHDSDRRYQANARAMVVDQFFYVDAATSGARQSISAFGQLTENPYTSNNRTDINTWRISPYLQHRFGSTAVGTARFTRDGVDAGDDRFGSSTASTTLLDLSSGSAFTNFGWNLTANRQDLNNKLGGDSSSETSVAGIRYRVAPRFSLTASAGYDSYDFAALGGRTAGRSWTAGFIWTPSARTRVQAAFGHRYFGKTGSLDASHRTRKTVWTAVYSDDVTTTRSQFTLPAAIDTAAMLDGMFASAFPDAVQRRAAIQAYMASAGLPATLADSVNYLSNRYIRLRRLQAGAVLRGARSSLTLSAFQDQRTALSLQQSDSGLLGGQLSALNDNVRQRGANIDASYRLSVRTDVRAGAYIVRAHSLDTGIISNNRNFRLGLTSDIDKHLRGSVELRHIRGSFGFNSNDVFHENAVAATLSVQY